MRQTNPKAMTGGVIDSLPDSSTVCKRFLYYTNEIHYTVLVMHDEKA